MKIQTPLTEIAYREWGRGGIPLLGLHGWLDNANSFHFLGPLLAENGFHLVAIDFPGHGLSGWRPPRVAYNYVDFLADIRSFIDQWGWTKFSLLGHSMGGGLASLFAGAFPDRVERLILVEALGPVTTAAEDGPKSLGIAIERFLKEVGEGDDSRFADREQLVRLRMRAGHMKPESAQVLIERGSAVSLGGEGFSLRRDPRLNLPSFFRLTEEQVSAFLRAILCPSLAIWGENGFHKERPYLAERAKLVSNLTEVYLPGYHHLHLDEPLSVASTIRDWWEALP